MNDISDNASLAAHELVLEKMDSWYETFLVQLPNLVVASLVMLFSFLLARVVYRLAIRIVSKKVAQTSVSRLIARVSSISIVLLGLFLSLNALNLGKSLNGLLAGAGISGLVIGLALQGTLSNTFGGIMLSLRKNIRIGNWIETNGYKGEVLDINLNYLVLREADNNMVVLPNKSIIERPFKNYSLSKLWRISIECGVAYDSDLDEVESICRETIAQLYDQHALNKELEFYYTAFGESSIDFICRFWISGETGVAKLKARSRAIKAIKAAFDTHGITIPFPMRTLKIEGIAQENISY